MNNMIFSTGGDWDSTTLYNNGQELPADRLFVELVAGRDEYGNPASGGIRLGGEITAIVNPQGETTEFGIFPGRLEMTFPGHTIVMENNHPAFQFEFTRVTYNGCDVTDHIMDVTVDIDSVNNNVKAFLTLFKPHWLGSDEVATYNII